MSDYSKLKTTSTSILAIIAIDISSSHRHSVSARMRREPGRTFESMWRTWVRHKCCCIITLAEERRETASTEVKATSPLTKCTRGGQIIEISTFTKTTKLRTFLRWARKLMVRTHPSMSSVERCHRWATKTWLVRTPLSQSLSSTWIIQLVDTKAKPNAARLRDKD